MKKKTPVRAGLIYSAVLILVVPLLLLTCRNEQVLPTQDEAKAAVWEKIKAANEKWASVTQWASLKVRHQISSGAMTLVLRTELLVMKPLRHILKPSQAKFLRTSMY